MKTCNRIALSMGTNVIIHGMLKYTMLQLYFFKLRIYIIAQEV